jgi:hypothetical protein
MALRTASSRSASASGNLVRQGTYNPLLQVVPVRQSPLEPDPKVDGQIIERFSAEHSAQSEVLIVRDRQIELNVRMLLGQQWNVWHPVLGQFFDTASWLSDAEKAYRRTPVINKLLKYFMVTHSRLTEGQPILTMLPGPDRIDAELASTMDALVKKDWRDAGMEDVHDLLMMWLVVAGRAHAISRIDLGAGEWQPWIAEAPLPLEGPDGLPIPGPDGRPMMTPQPIPNVPLNADGSPNAVMLTSGQVKPLGPPHMERIGGIAVDVYSPLQVRGQWGPQPWHKKRWHDVVRFLTPEEVYEAWKVEIEPDVTATDAVNVATLERVLFGSGFFTGALGRLNSGWSDSRAKGALCTVHERWEKPIPFDERLTGTWAEVLIETPENPGGRHTIWTPKQIISDGPREEAWRFTSPVRCWDFVRLAGRPGGVTPLEMMISPQRAYNRGRGQLEEQAALLGNPQLTADSQFGVLPEQIDNRPGHIYVGLKRPGVKSMEYLEAPPVSADVIKSLEFSADEIEEIGGMRGLEGGAPSRNASGDLVEELRFNADRILGATSRRMPAEYARMADDWRLLYRRVYTDQMIIAINGDDQLAETLSVLPEVFKEGHVNIMPDAESMLPEGRGERQQRAERLWMAGAFGDPKANESREAFLQLSRFPNYARMARPGGADREMAELENGKILMGEFQQPVLEWYDHFVHLTVHERYMKGPQFLKQQPMVQQAFAIHRILHIQQVQRLLAQQAPGMGGGPPGAPGAPGGGAPSALPGKPAPKQLTPGAPKPPASVVAQGGQAPTAIPGPQG